MGTTNDGLYQFGGVPVPFEFTGKNWFVRPSTGSDGNAGNKTSRAFKTLAKARDKASYGDTVRLIAESNTAASTTDYQSSVLSWNVDGVHLIGVGNMPMMGQRSRISNLSSAAAIVNGLIVVSANNCLIRGIEVFQGQGGTNPTGASIAMTVSGQRNRIENCQISGIGHAELDDATSCSLTVTGSENTFYNDYIGLDTIIRGTATAEVRVTGAARTTFSHCMIQSYTSLSTFKAVICTSIDRFVEFDDCRLSAVQGITSAVAPTGAILNTTPNGNLIFHGSAVYGYADISTLADSTILCSTWAANAANAGVGGAATPS